jgi:hypothetical protein
VKTFTRFPCLTRLVVADITMEARDVRHVAAGVRDVLDPAGACAAERFCCQRDAFHGEDDLGGGGEAVVTAVHFGRADVAGLTGYCELEVAGVHGGDNDADFGAGRFHDRALLDMQFQPGAPVARGGDQGSGLTGVGQGPGDGDAVVVGGREGGVQR